MAESNPHSEQESTELFAGTNEIYVRSLLLVLLLDLRGLRLDLAYTYPSEIIRAYTRALVCLSSTVVAGGRRRGETYRHGPNCEEKVSSLLEGEKKFSMDIAITVSPSVNFSHFR